MAETEHNELHRLSRQELLVGGHTAVAGYGGSIAVRQALKALGPRCIFVIPASYTATVGATNLRTAWRVPFVHSLFECSAATAAGIRAALEARGVTDVAIVSWAGDAGTADIGFQAISGAAERNDDIIHVCYDDEAYMNTGGQAGGLTPLGAWTVVTPGGKLTRKKDMLAIMEAHGVPYVASASIAYPLDFIAKLQKAHHISGFRYLHVLTPNPTTWGFPATKTIAMARMAVECGLWPLFEVHGGRRRTTVAPERRIPVAEYVRGQSRFRTLSAQQVDELQRAADSRCDC